MKISNHLPHFQKVTLLVTAGKQEACFFLANNDHVHQIHHFKINKPEYTDNESRTERRGSGGASMFRGGSPFKHIEDQLVKSFVKQLADQTNDLALQHNIEDLYLFCPTYLSNQIEQALPSALQNKIEYIFYGNYHHQHPFVLLSKIQEYLKMEKDERTIEPIKKEALEILKNTQTGFGRMANQST